jgi:predicted TPR repeat methyltransferase
VELSSEMVKRAEARGIYDELAVEELTAFLTGRPQAFDLVASGDTVCYFGALEELMAAAPGRCASVGTWCSRWSGARARRTACTRTDATATRMGTCGRRSARRG